MKKRGRMSVAINYGYGNLIKCEYCGAVLDYESDRWVKEQGSCYDEPIEWCWRCKKEEKE